MTDQYKPILYSFVLSPAVRSVKLVAASIGLELEEKTIDLFVGEQLQEDFLKINPQHTVPVLDDNGKIIWDSHAISAYLVGKYAKDDSLYRKDLYVRARIDQRLHFNSSVLWRNVCDCNGFIYDGGSEIPADKISRIYKNYDTLEAFLSSDKFLVENLVTIADLCAVNSVTTLQYHAPLNTDKYPKILAWLNRVTKLPYYEEHSGRFVPTYHAFLRKRQLDNKNSN